MEEQPKYTYATKSVYFIDPEFSTYNTQVTLPYKSSSNLLLSRHQDVKVT